MSSGSRSLSRHSGLLLLTAVHLASLASAQQQPSASPSPTTTWWWQNPANLPSTLVWPPKGSTTPPYPLRQFQSDWLQAAATISSMMSIIYISFTAWKWKRSGERVLSFPNKLIGYEVLANLLMCLATLAGRCGSRQGCPVDYCKLQGFFYQISSLTSHLWMAFVAWKMYQWIVLKKHEERLHKKLPSTFGCIMIAAVGTAIYALVGSKSGLIGQCASWCWINFHDSDMSLTTIRTMTNYLWLIASWSFNIFVLVVIGLGTRKKSRNASLEAAVQNRLTLYVFVFTLCWFFPVVDFAVEYYKKINAKEANVSMTDTFPLRPIYFPTSLASAIFMPLHGFGNCLVYHGYLDPVIPWLTKHLPACIRFVFAKLPWLSNVCGCCLRCLPEVREEQGGGSADVKKFVVRRASSLNGPGQHTGKPLKRSSLIDRFAIYAEPSSVGASGAGGAAQAKNPLGLHKASGGAEEASAATITPSFNTTNKHRADILAVAGRGYVPVQYSIFITTFNMGEAKLGAIYSNLGDWIVRGHDIYSIAVQECLDLGAVRDAIHAHLGGPGEYKMFCAEIGSDNTALNKMGYHGYIALTVFVRTSDVETACVRETVRSTSVKATGRNLIVTTAQNKGAVGIPFQIHDTSVAFLAAHLPSDEKGKSKLAKRNAAAADILKEVVLAPEDVDFDMHLQHDHVFFTGDLNYRMNQEADGPYLPSIIDACRLEKAELGDDPQWLARKYSLLRSPHGDDFMCPKDVERRLIQAAKAKSADGWLHVLEADELRNTIRGGLAFTGFDEELPAFPPTYKRIKDGGCGDYTDLAEFVRGFSHTGIEGGDADGEDSSSPSSSSASGDASGDVESRAAAHSTASAASTSSGLELTATNSSSSSFAPALSHSTSRELSSRRTKTKNLRTPSYTDRILYHSLDDRQAKLSVEAYDFCDVVRASDHRPVSLVCHLEVNASVLFPTNFAQPLSDREVEKLQSNLLQVTNKHTGKEEHISRSVVGSSTLYLFELTVSDLAVELFEQQGVVPSGEALEAQETRMSEQLRRKGDSDASRGPKDKVIMHEPSLQSQSHRHLQRAQSTDDTTFVRPNSVGVSSSSSSSLSSSSAAASAASDAAPSLRDSIPDSHSLDMPPKASSASTSTSGTGTDAVPGSGSGSGSGAGAGPGAGKKDEGERSSSFTLSKVVTWLFNGEQAGSHDATIREVEVVFPLPSKDPIAREKTTFRMAKAFGIDKSRSDDADLISSLKETAMSVSETLHTHDAHDFEPMHKSHVMQPSVRFPFRAPHSIRTLFKGSTQMCRGLRVVGCVIPELGAHVLIKLLSASGAELGECVVSLSHLVRLDAKKQHRCEVSKIPVTSGSKEVGEAKGIFTLTFLASVTEEHAPAAPNPDVESGSVNPLFGRDLRTATVASTSSNSSASHAEGR